MSLLYSTVRFVMRCPYCQSDRLKVTDSRDALDTNTIRRRRECLACHKRFTTFEAIAAEPLQIFKRNGVYQDFSFEKLLAGIEKACRHTTISREQVHTIASSIHGALLLADHPSVTSKWIGDRVMEHLRELDTIAYIRFACEYRRFKDVGQLMEAIRSAEPDLQS